MITITILLMYFIPLIICRAYMRFMIKNYEFNCTPLIFIIPVVNITSIIHLFTLHMRSIKFKTNNKFISRLLNKDLK